MNTKPTTPRMPSRLQAPADLLDRHERGASSHLDADALVDMESDQSFPASDAPGWTLGSTKAS